MKKKLLLISALITIYSTTVGQDFKRYQFKSGKVVYKMTGVQTGTETLYFDDYGRKEVHFSDTVIDMMGVKQRSNTQTLIEGTYIYTIDKEKNTAQKMENPLNSMFSEEDDLQKVGEDIMKKMGGKKIGTETINGKKCDIWEVKKMGGKIWVWNSLAIRTIVDIMGMKITQEAQSIETDIEVSPDLFKIPVGTEIQDIGKIENMMGN